jgi:hypothetical protein
LNLSLTNCARKTAYIGGLGSKKYTPSIESKILSFKTVGIADTVTAYISGNIFGKDSTEKQVSIDTLIYATVGFISLERKDTVGTHTDLHGRFQKHLRAGTYDVYVKYSGYVGLMIKDVPFGSGELKELNVLLGQEGYQMVE